MSTRIDVSKLPNGEQFRRALALDLAIDLAKSTNEFSDQITDVDDLIENACTIDAFIRNGRVDNADGSIKDA
jgi:hypothetical protein